MKIAWVEDDYANFIDGVKLFVSLLDQINATELINEFDAQDDDDKSPEVISSFFREKTLNDLEWFESYSDMHQNIKNENVNRWDVVILDLNLEKSFDTKKYLSISPETAGFALYLQLLNIGYSSENIVFSTNNANQTQKLEQICSSYGIPKPQYLEKVKPEQLKGWLLRHLEDNHMTLRRGVLDGCSYMISKLLDDPSHRIRINRCGGNSFYDDTLSAEALKDWLEAWPRLLPCSPETNNDYAVFLLALLAIWDGKRGIQSDRSYASSNTALAQALKSAIPNTTSEDSDDGFNTIPNILRYARNWVAHNNALNDASLCAVAYLFLLSGRGLLCTAAKPLRHENILLTLLNNYYKSTNASRSINYELEDIQKDLYEKTKLAIKSSRFTDRLPLYDEKSKRPFFCQMANDYVTSSPIFDFRYSAEELLMLSLLFDDKTTNSGLVSELRNLIENALPIRSQRGTVKMTDGDIIKIIIDSIYFCADDTGWALSASVGARITKSMPNFKKILRMANQNYMKLSSVLDAHPEIFEISLNGAGTQYAASCIRLKPIGETPLF